MRRLTSFFIILSGLVCWVLFLPSLARSEVDAVQWRNPVPRIQELGLDWQALQQLVSGRMMLLVHAPSDYEIPDKQGKILAFKAAQSVTAFAVIDGHVDKVKQVVSNYERYVDFMPRTTSANIVQESGRHTLVSYVLNFEIPLINLDIKYLLQHTEESNGDLSVLMLEGDMKGGASRWEFIALGNNKTLLMYTNWNDIESVGMVFRTVVKAQPEMKLTSPALSAALAVEAIQEYFTQQVEVIVKVDDEVASAPIVPSYQADNITLLSTLSRIGKVLFIYPPKKVLVDEKVTELMFVTVLGVVDGDLQAVKTLSTEFDRYPEYFRQVTRVKEFDVGQGREVDWHFRFGFGIISIPIRYSLAYHWQGEHQLLFHRIAGDIDCIVGGLEWVATDESSTLSFYTSAIALNDSSNWIMKVVKQMPKLAMIGGVSYGLMVLETQIPWTEAMIKGEQYRPAWKRDKRRRGKRRGRR